MMNGSFDTTAPQVHPSNQQQQEIIAEEQRHPLQNTTTPAWSITAKEEQKEEDKNNDSGVSPDHYTSASSSTANCSLSPSSTTSQDSNNMQCSTFEYSPQGLYKNCGSSLDFTQRQNDEQSEQNMDIVSSTVKQSIDDVQDIEQDSLQCPICAFSCLNRLNFTDHLTVHCTAQGETPDFIKQVLCQLAPTSLQDESNRASPPQGERSEQESEEADEPGLRVPRMNSQGKVKTFKCKQCDFIAITKLEFWEHSRGHIKVEKLLTCPKCPFVTEYKHHLEYHLRNHFGSKPFKCDKCSYTCVNKSMLNSHLKSHSNVYQYRCANCSYATKYCHSLKLHLRKYSHQPAMVLNADGSPNPLPIIDVYGTRRGPKQKPIKSQEDATSPEPVNISMNNVQPPMSSNDKLETPPQLSPTNHHLPPAAVSGVSGNNGGLVQAPPMMASFPYSPIFGAFPLAQRFSPSEEGSAEQQLDRIKSNALMEYAKALECEKSADEVSRELALKLFTLTGMCNMPVQMINGIANNVGTSMIQNEKISPSKVDMETRQSTSVEVKAIPLDLSKPESNSNNNDQVPTSSPRITGTSRRKGIAIKLDRRILEEETDEEIMQGSIENFTNSQQLSALDSPGSSHESKDSDHNCGGASNEFSCHYCEISFGNVVMYTVHMGYHGYKNPFTCNMCGHECTDKVSFFLHIARSKHS